MGLCASSADNVEVDILDNLNRNKVKEKVNKLLLLGAGSSGKSTLFKQIITIYGEGFNESERLKYINPVHNNILI